MPVLEERPQLNFRSILFATDFSVSSQTAGHYAQKLADHCGAELVIAHAFTLSNPAMEIETRFRKESQQRREVQALLIAETAKFVAKSAKTRTALLDGEPADQILALAKKEAPTLIVVGTHGGGEMERHFIGSKAESILRASDWPVFTVGPRVVVPVLGPLAFKRILYPTDLSITAARAVPFAVRFAESFGSDMDLLHVTRNDDIKFSEKPKELHKEFYEALEHLIPRQAMNFREPSSFVEVGQAYEEILKHIRERSIDLLVLGVKRSSYLGMHAQTSGVFPLIVNATCPVLTISGE